MSNQSAHDELLQNAARITAAELNIALWELLRQQQRLLNEDRAVIISTFSEGGMTRVPLEVLLNASLKSKMELIECLTVPNERSPYDEAKALFQEDPVDRAFNGPYV